MHLPSIATKIATLAIGVVAFATGSPALAADIGSIIGTPGSLMWAAACPAAPAPQTPMGTSQLTQCAGANPACLHRVAIDSVEFPKAVCSDGTPGVFYVRPGTGDDINRWVIHLQGGGGCRDYDDCLARWCGQQGNLPYTANKMSSDWNADGITDLFEHVNGPGMTSISPNNKFSTWTHVWAYYCSSDSWQGRASDVTFSGANSFTLDARGHTILYAMRKMLRKLNANPAWSAAGGFVTPDLDDASEILLTGTSAGAKGAISNADWFLSVFPNTDTSLVVDANLEVSDSVLVGNDIWVDLDNDNTGDNLYYSERIGIFKAEWAVGGHHRRIDAFTDETCRSYYEPINRMDRCSQISTMLRLNIGGSPIIETPTFVRFDLEDSVLRKRYTDHPNSEGYSLLIGGPSGTPTTRDDFAFLSRASLLEIYDDHDSVSGVIAPRCGDHVGLEDTHTFAAKLTPDFIKRSWGPISGMLAVGSDTTVHDALWDWLNVGGGGRVDIRRFDTDAPGSHFSTCN